MTSPSPLELSVLLGIILGLGWQFALALRRGWVRNGNILYGKDAQPVEFRAHLAYWVIGIGLAAAMLTHLAWRDRSFSFLPSFLVLFTIGLPAAFWLVRAVQTGATGFGKLSFERHEEPRGYVAFLIIYAAAVTFAVWQMSTLKVDREPSYADVVEPVVDAMRVRLSAERPLPFRNIGVDDRSDMVCGEVVLGSAPRRFFGAVLDGQAKVVLEREGANFNSAFEQACGSSRTVPD